MDKVELINQLNELKDAYHVIMRDSNEYCDIEKNVAETKKDIAKWLVRVICQGIIVVAILGVAILLFSFRNIDMDFGPICKMFAFGLFFFDVYLVFVLLKRYKSKGIDDNDYVRGIELIRAMKIFKQRRNFAFCAAQRS